MALQRPNLSLLSASLCCRPLFAVGLAPSFTGTAASINLHPPVDNVGDVSPIYQELHDFLPIPSELCPARIRLRVLLQPSQHLLSEPEIDLAQFGSTCPPN